jgi:hypothetical protein
MIGGILGAIKAIAPALGKLIPGPVGSILGQVLPKFGDIFQTSAPQTENSKSQMSLADREKGVKAGGGPAAAPKQGGFFGTLANMVTNAFPQAAPFVNAFKGIFG